MSFHNFSFESFSFDDEKWIGSPQEQDDDKALMMDSSIFNVFSVIDDEVPLVVDPDSLSAPSVDNTASNFLFADLPSDQANYHQQPTKVRNNAAAAVDPPASVSVNQVVCVDESPQLPLVVLPEAVPQQQHIVASSPLEPVVSAACNDAPVDDSAINNKFSLDEFIGEHVRNAAASPSEVVAYNQLLSTPVVPAISAAAAAAAVAAAAGAPSPERLSDGNKTPTLSLKLSTTMESLWYAERPFPAFTLELCDTATGTRVPADNVVINVGLRDGFGKDAPEKLSEAVRDHSFVMHNGTVTINSIRFRGVSSKAGGHFRLVISVKNDAATAAAVAAAGAGTHHKAAAPFVSDKIQVLSYRLYHAPKVDNSKLRPEDAVSKMKGIGNQYAKRLSSLGIQRIDQLAAIDIDRLGADGTAELLQCLRKERGALTQAKLAQYIKQAADICSRCAGDTSSRQTHTVARTATSNVQPKKRKRPSMQECANSATFLGTPDSAIKRIRALTGISGF